MRRTWLTITVHPRVCGERTSSSLIVGSSAGSSPRVRGTHAPPLAAKFDCRFIPACAGNAEEYPAQDLYIPVHPRVCGERVAAALAATGQAGSSPRVRGTLWMRDCREPKYRFIPACAGNAVQTNPLANRRAVHPRVCGERRRVYYAFARPFGSSPRVRGTHVSGSRRVDGERFIPACAGNARRAHGALRPATVHPRVCGERRSPTLNGAYRVGSSPRVRGTRLRSRHPEARVRFIPACAGNAARVRPGVDGYAVHPRVCGERANATADPLDPGGSSPRVRGTHADTPIRSARSRFIPACAGNAPRVALNLVRLSVHPRVCGERRR